jgi:hypothetical protein
MSLRTELINAKINGELTKVAAKKLSELITNFQDFTKFADIIEEKEASVVDAAKKNPLMALSIAGMAGAIGHSAISHLKTRSAHKGILKELKNDKGFPDKQKVEKIFRMVSQFAPKVSTNSTFARSVVDSLYHSPAITAPMIKDIVEVEKGISGRDSGIGGILSAAKSVHKGGRHD